MTKNIKSKYQNSASQTSFRCLVDYWWVEPSQKIRGLKKIIFMPANARHSIIGERLLAISTKNNLTQAIRKYKSV